jgi:hypothetical protein
VLFDKTYNNSLEVKNVLDDPEWNVQITFSFGDGTTISESVPGAFPYSSEPEIVPIEFKRCVQ